MNYRILDRKHSTVIIALLFCLKISGQTTPTSVDNIHKTLNATGNDLVGSAGSASYSIGQVFYADVEESVNNLAQGVQPFFPDQTIWNGFNWDNGFPTSATDAFISGAYSVSENINANKLTVDNNAAVEIPSGFNVNLNESITVSSGSFTLNNNANLIQAFDEINSGSINVKRESSSLLRLDYTLWSSPVKNDSFFLQTFSPATSANRFYQYNSLTNFYNAVNPVAIPFESGRGYLIRMPNDASQTVRTAYLGMFTGVPVNGTVRKTIVNDGAGKRYNLVGNPYPSSLNISRFIADNSANITPTLYFWRKTNGSGSGAYCTFSGGIFTTNGEAGAADPQGLIQIGQGFFVEALESANTVIFNNEQRVPNNANQFFKTKAVERNTIWLNAKSTEGGFSQMAVGYRTSASVGVDSLDGKYFNDGPIALNSWLDNTDYVIQVRPLPFETSDAVALTFRAAAPGAYTIAIDHVEGLFASLPEIILRDNDNGSETNLKIGGYTFNAAAGDSNNRFLLKYQKSLAIETSNFDENGILVYQNRGKINIKSKVSTISNVQLYDIKGTLLLENSKISTRETSLDSAKFSDQVVVIKIRLEDKKWISRKIIIHNNWDKN